jgi:lactoylglutathione lyase
MLSRVLHTGVGVADLDKAVALYESLGFEVYNRFEKPEPKARVASVKKEETAFELWEFAEPGHPQVAFIRNHVAIYSDDLDADVQELVAQGYTLVIPVTEGVIMRYAFVQDAAGCCYEIATKK